MKRDSLVALAVSLAALAASTTARAQSEAPAPAPATATPWEPAPPPPAVDGYVFPPPRRVRDPHSVRYWEARRRNAMIPGTIFWLAGYFGMPFWARTLLGRGQGDEHAMGALMLIPGPGPVLAAVVMAGSNLNNREGATAVLLLASAAQLGGTAWFMRGISMHLHAIRRINHERAAPPPATPEPASVTIMPFASGADVGASLVGAF